MTKGILTTTVLTVALFSLLPARSFGADEGPYKDIYVGDYFIVGQKPNDGPAYKGRARIDLSPEGLVLSKTIGSKTVKEEGKFVRDIPGNESKRPVLLFKDTAHDQDQLMLCFSDANFDHYMTLWCTRSTSGKRASSPGFEAYYPMQAYFDETASPAAKR